MAKFTRGQSITFKREGKILTGIVEDAGTGIWGVRMADRKYYAVSEGSLVAQTPATKAGLQYGDIVVVGCGVKCPHSFNVGEEATFERDDHSDSPLFKQDGQTQYLDLSEITIGRKPQDNRTPAEKMGLAVGDEVTIKNASSRNLRGRIFFHYDDSTRIPRFRDEFGNQHYVHLEDVTKAPQGPKVGVLWSQAPLGATHYSLSEEHSMKWHKLDTAGNWHYINEYGRAIAYSEEGYARVATQVAIPGIVVAVNPMAAALDRVKVLEESIRQKQKGIDALAREIATLTSQKDDKLAVIKAAGFKVVDGELVKAGPSKDEWQSGDRVRCVKREGRGLANIIVGGIYRVKVEGDMVCVVDGDGDSMRRCVESDCFEFVERPPRLQDTPATEWKAGDTIEALVDSLDITKGQRYTITNMCTAIDLRVCFRDDVNFPRRRAASEYKLVARK